MTRKLEPSKNDPEIMRLSTLVEYQPGSVVSRTILKKEKGTLTLFAFDAGESLSEHTAPFYALVYIVDGVASVSIEKKSYQLSAGEALILPANRPHAVKATQRFKMLLTMIRS